MAIDWLSEVSHASCEIIKHRQHIHAHPELGNHEYETAAYIENVLKSYGIETRRLLDTAVVGILKGEKSGRAAALRADMDALPISEQTGCSFSSLNDGIMHACGHDVHVSAALGAARLLSEHRHELCGDIHFIFQPDEEGDGGAKRLCELGVMNGINAVFGAHVSPDIGYGKVGIRYGKFYAASDIYRVTVHGKGAHGAEPEKGIDALFAAAQMLCLLHELPKELYPERAVVTTGRLISGTAVNIVPGEAYFEGIIRTLGADSRTYIKRRIREAIDDISAKTGVSCDLIFRESYPGVVNTDSAAMHAEKSAAELLGTDNVIRIAEPTMTTEDFGYYIEKTDGCFYHIGVGGNNALHSAAFLPPDGASVIAAAVHAAVLYDYLRSYQ